MYFLLLLVCLFNLGMGLHLPSNFLKCKRTDPHLGECLKQAVQDALPKLADGLPSLSVPNLDPFWIPSMTIGEGKGAVHVVQNYKNASLYNLAHTTVENITASATDTEFILKALAFSSELKLESDYDFNGQVLLLPIVGVGKSTLKIKDVKLHLNFTGKIVEKKGDMYLEVQNCTLGLIDPSKVEFHFGNLFNGNERLGNEMNTILNENWKEVFEDVKSSYEEVFALIIKNYANNIFTKVPYNELISA